jgi:menaquinone-dependent protoporphyrinogen oxidase
MCEVPIFYATSEGQTRRIAERIAAELGKHGLDSRAIPIISDESARMDWSRVRGAVIGASIHLGKHQPEARAFARVHHVALSSVPSLFVSVSMAAASKDPDEVEAVRQIAVQFTAATGWTPTHVASIAGRLAYTQYNWFVRLMMRRIARQHSAATDTSRDHEYTDWQEVERLADELAYDVRRRQIFHGGGESLARRAS